jgi:hypothetical protein
MFRLQADKLRLASIAVAVGILLGLTGCVVTPEPIPLFDGEPQSNRESGVWDAAPAMDMGTLPDMGVLPAVDAPSDGLVDGPSLADGPSLVDGQPDALGDSTPGGDADLSGTQDGLTDDAVAQE